VRRTLALTAIVALVVGATYLVRGGLPHPTAVRSSSPPGPRADLGAVGVGASPPGAGQRSEVDRLIGVYEDQVRRHPSALDLTFLGRLYLQRGRMTGHAASYAQAEEALSRALEIYPEDPEARGLLAQVRFTTHDFRGALELSQELLGEDPSDMVALALAGDARLELGEYANAAADYDDLGRRMPGAPTVAVRRARLAFLLCDVGEARRLAASAEAAAERAGASDLDLAWYRSFRGHLDFDSGRYLAALRAYRSALRLAPEYHVPRAGLARALAADGRVDPAIHQYRRAVSVLPDPDYLWALGDLYRLRGHRELARQQYDTIAAVATLSPVNRRLYDRQLAAFYLDHDRRIALAARIAAASLSIRKDVYGWDLHAWALYRSGHPVQAREASDRALRLGTRDARLWFHAGMISLALGDEDRAREQLATALEISPAFDPVQAEVARTALRGLP
jgi:tetratricopeptide (TPR) repeat protein